MDSNVRDTWEKFLNPEELRSRLIVTSIYLAGYEILKDTVLGRVKSFFTHGLDENGEVVNAKYQKVLARNKSPLYASLLWHQEMGAIDNNDMAAFERVKACRNDLAHEITTFIGGKRVQNRIDEPFQELVSILRKIEVWWIREFEMALDPEVDGDQVEDADIFPGAIMCLELMQRIALGKDDEASRYYREFMRLNTETERTDV